MKKDITILNGLDSFECLGSSCERDCCHGWDSIAVDDKTVSNWQAVKEESKKQFLTSLLDLSDNDNPVLNSCEKKCKALNKDNLCQVQLEYGHEELPEICREFPRLSFSNGLNTIKTAALSCPAVVDIILKQKASVLFKSSKEDTVDISADDKLQFEMNALLHDILDYHEYPIGIRLFFIADIFFEIIQNMKAGNISPFDVENVRLNIPAYLEEIKKAYKNNKLRPNPVTSGSYWATIYNYCESRKINSIYRDKESAPLTRAILKSSGTASDFGKIYSIVKKYKKQSNKKSKAFTDQFEKYVRILFVNKGFPITNKTPLDVLLVEIFVNLSLFQLLLWVEMNKSGGLSEQLIRKVIIEIDRQSVLSNVVIAGLKTDSHMMQLDKYCNTFLDLY